MIKAAADELVFLPLGGAGEIGMNLNCYGFGPPGYVNGRWNGGSIGPCYTQTPIGFIWNCGM